MDNPNPSRITSVMWQFWLNFKAFEPSVKLGGIYANKSGYHNTRDANVQHWPGDYSYSQYELDRKGPGDKAAAIDLTFPDAQAGNFSTIAKYSKRLLDSGRDLSDERGNYLREFYGNTDSDREVEGWDFQRVGTATSDDSHLWHIHISVMRGCLNDPKAFRALLSILKGETVKVWREKEAALTGDKPAPPPPRPKPPAPKLQRAWPKYMARDHYFGLITGPNQSHGGYYSSERADVKAIQQRLIVLGFVPRITNPNSSWADGEFGPETKAAAERWQRAKYARYTTRYGEVWSDDWARLFTY